MLVVHLISGVLWAGAEVATFHLVCALAARSDCEVSALVLNRGPLFDRLREAGVCVSLESEAGRGFLSLARAVRDRVAGADLVHAHRYKEDLLAAASGRPWIATQHGRPESFRGSARLRAAIYRGLDLAAKRFSARAVVAVSDDVASWLRPRVGARKVSVVWNGIDDPAAGAAIGPWRSRALRVGVLARLVPVKDVGLAIDAVARTPDVELEIVGDGPERASLEAHVLRSAARERVRFVGIDPAPLSRVASWRALLVTSVHEGNPIGVIEALALGTPVVHANVAGVADVLGGCGGLAASDRSPGAVADALQRLVADDVAGEAASLAARARFLAAFRADAAAERMVAIYRRALAASV